MPPPHFPFLQQGASYNSERTDRGSGSASGASGHGSGTSGSASGTGSGRASGCGSGTGNQTGNVNINTNTHSTPATSVQSSELSLASGSGSSALTRSTRSSGSGAGSGSFRAPAVDTRSNYKGFSFVFATDAYHSRETVYGKGPGNNISYLKPIHEGQTVDALPPIRLPYFFTGFHWTDIDGQSCRMSRNGLCDAWQIAFNRLIYYASFLEEDTVRLEDVDVEFFKREFGVWNDLFCELDQTLGRLYSCEVSRTLPHFQPSIGLADLTNPQNATSPQTPFNHLSSTFLCAAREILERHTKELEPPENVKQIEENAEGWEPCTGYAVIQATQWGGSRDGEGNENEMRGESSRFIADAEGDNRQMHT